MSTDSTRPPADLDKHGSGRPPATPYGPQPLGVDETAGGADSSPYDNEPTGDARQQRAEEERRTGKQTPTDGTNQTE